ncbi:hypothetical protein ACP70R_020980 [Stipagrostis hirtigluma subsp. patula]
MSAPPPPSGWWARGRRARWAAADRRRTRGRAAASGGWRWAGGGVGRAEAEAASLRAEAELLLLAAGAQTLAAAATVFWPARVPALVACVLGAVTAYRAFYVLWSFEAAGSGRGAGGRISARVVGEEPAGSEHWRGRREVGPVRGHDDLAEPLGVLSIWRNRRPPLG